MRSNCIVVLLLMHAATSAAQHRPLPEIEPFIKEVRERLQIDRTLQTSYAYVETRRELTLDKKGRATGVSEKVFESYPGFPGEPRWERLIAEDGTPVPAEKLEEGDRRRHKKAESVQFRSTSGQTVGVSTWRLTRESCSRDDLGFDRLKQQNEAERGLRY
jgi:hypothetical protein